MGEKQKTEMKKKMLL